MKKHVATFVEVVRYVTTIPILIYQKTISPDHGLLRFVFPEGYCRFYPSCSEYSRQAILKKGLVKGSILGSWRILRCNPFNKGGVDEIS